MGKMVRSDREPQERGKARSNGSQSGRVEWKGYVSPQISQSEKRAYKAWSSDPHQFQKQMEVLPKEGYKMSVDYVANERAYRASLYCQKAGSPNAGYCLTMFAGSWDEAFYRLVFVHSEILGGDWTKVITPGGWKDDWNE